MDHSRCGGRDGRQQRISGVGGRGGVGGGVEALGEVGELGGASGCERAGLGRGCVDRVASVVGGWLGGRMYA